MSRDNGLDEHRWQRAVLTEHAGKMYNTKSVASRLGAWLYQWHSWPVRASAPTLLKILKRANGTATPRRENPWPVRVVAEGAAPFFITALPIRQHEVRRQAQQRQCRACASSGEVGAARSTSAVRDTSIVRSSSAAPKASSSKSEVESAPSARPTKRARSAECDTRRSQNPVVRLHRTYNRVRLMYPDSRRACSMQTFCPRAQICTVMCRSMQCNLAPLILTHRSDDERQGAYGNGSARPYRDQADCPPRQQAHCCGLFWVSSHCCICTCAREPRQLCLADQGSCALLGQQRPSKAEEG